MRIKGLITILTLISNFSFGQQLSNLYGDYLGQITPGDSAIVFAPDIISITGSSEYICSVHPSMKLIVWTSGKKSGKIIDNKYKKLFYLKRDSNIWNQPKQLLLSDEFSEEEGIFSSDGTKLFYSSNRPNKYDPDLWCAEISEEGWKQAQKLVIPSMLEGRQIYVTTTNDGTLYFSSRKLMGKDRKYRIYCSKKINGKYSKPTFVMEGAHSFVHPEGKYILLDIHDEKGDGKMDIGICFKLDNNSFSKPINLGNKINTNFNETCATLSPDLKYIFFSRYNEPDQNSNIYWISSQIIDETEKEFRKNK
ncbi:MAG: hypothetical protein ACEPOZ_08545 [Marinifilaceae bacterium]